MNTLINNSNAIYLGSSFDDELKQALEDCRASERESAVPQFNHDLAEDESKEFHRVDLSLWDSNKCHSGT